jgi:hydrocephalus-inducing protein
MTCYPPHNPSPSSTATGIYTLSPAAGSIPPGGYEEVALRFSPTEVEDAARTLVCDIPELDPSCQPFTRPITGQVRGRGLMGAATMSMPCMSNCFATAPVGSCPRRPTASASPHPQVLRPWCHFELHESDYISGGRRNPEQPGPSGAIEPLDPATKVCISVVLWNEPASVSKSVIVSPFVEVKIKLSLLGPAEPYQHQEVEPTGF